MFDLKVMVEEKNLAKILWALDGLIVGMPSILPVRAAKVFKKKVVSTHPLKGASLLSQVEFALFNWETDTIEWEDFKALMLKLGVAKDSKGYIVHGLKDRKIIKAAPGSLWRTPTYKILKQTEA